MFIDDYMKDITNPSFFSPSFQSVLQCLWIESGCGLEEAKRRRRTRTRDCWPLQCLHCLWFEWKSPCQQPCLKKFRQKEAPSVSSNTVITTDVGASRVCLVFEWRRLCTQRMNVPLTTPRKQNAKWCPWLLHQLNERRELSRRVQIYSRCVWEFQSVHLRSELQRLQLKPQDLRTSSVVGAGVTEHF